MPAKKAEGEMPYVWSSSNVPLGGYEHSSAPTIVNNIIKLAFCSLASFKSSFGFSISLNAAKQIGLTIPESVLFRADRVIK